jgi:hypothetical protein
MDSATQLRVMAIDAGLVRREPAAAYTVVAAHKPDIVAFSGAPRYQRWRSKRAALARQLGLVVATADRVGGMFVATSLRADIEDTSFALSSSSAGTSPAVICVTFEVAGTPWRVVVAATGGAAEYAASDVPTVVVGGVGGPGAITVDRSVTVESCGPVRVAESTATFALLGR